MSTKEALKPAQLLEDTFLRILWDGRTRIIVIEWKESTSAMTDEQFKAELTLFATHVEERRAPRILVDVRSFRHQIGADAQQWRVRNISTRYNAAGVQRLAFLFSKDAPIPPMANQSAEDESFLTQAFTNLDEATAWLTAQLPRMRCFTDAGVEVPVVTTEQMREIDRIAVNETGPNLFQMMENAGRNLALQAMEILGARWNRATVIVLAGGGGNGGGGICAARHLANRDVGVKLCLADPHRLGPVAAFQRKVFDSTSGTEIGIADLQQQAPDLIVDALIGYGLESAPAGPIAQLIRWANGAGTSILALDVPSGVDSTTGHTPGDFITARWTMTLALPKSGLVPDKTGDLILADIGIPRRTYERAGVRYTAPFGNSFRVQLTRR